jgi:hypothetical protein
MDVSAVASVVEVAAALSVFKFDAVVSDWDLGRGGTGGQVYDLVRERQPTLVTRFMFLCGDRPVTTAHLPWLQKPARNRDVVAAVTELVFSSARGGRQTGVRGSLA